MQGKGCFIPNQGMSHLPLAHNLPNRTGHPPWAPCLQIGHRVVTPGSFRSLAVLLGWNRSKCVLRVPLGEEDLQSAIAFTPKVRGADGQILLRTGARREVGLMHRHH